MSAHPSLSELVATVRHYYALLNLTVPQRIEIAASTDTAISRQRLSAEIAFLKPHLPQIITEATPLTAPSQPVAPVSVEKTDKAATIRRNETDEPASVSSWRITAQRLLSSLEHERGYMRQNAYQLSQEDLAALVVVIDKIDKDYQAINRLIDNWERGGSLTNDNEVNFSVETIGAELRAMRDSQTKLQKHMAACRVPEKIQRYQIRLLKLAAKIARYEQLKKMAWIN